MNKLPVINTNATSFPEAAVAAAFKSVSLKEEAMVVPSVRALVLMASRGYPRISVNIEASFSGDQIRTVIRYGNSQVPLPQPA